MGFPSTHAWDDMSMRCYSGVWCRRAQVVCFLDTTLYFRKLHKLANISYRLKRLCNFRTWRVVSKNTRLAPAWFDGMFFCKILARWVYINTRMRWQWRCVAIEWFDALFFCKIVARWVFTLHTHEMSCRCVAIVGFDAMFFCKILARWVYLNTRMRWHGDAWL